MPIPFPFPSSPAYYYPFLLPTTLFPFPPFSLHKPLLLPPLIGGPGLLPPENFLRASDARRSVLEQFWLQHGMHITCVFVSGINFLNFVLRVFDILANL